MAMFLLLHCSGGYVNVRINASGTKFDAESDFEVHLAVAPQKPDCPA